MNKLHMMLFASIATVISLSALQENVPSSNFSVEKAANSLYFGAENCEHLAEDIFPFMQDVVGIDGSRTMEQLEFIVNYKKEGKTPLAIVQSKNCQKCDELAELLGIYTIAIEAAKVLEISHLTLEEMQTDSNLKNKMDTIMDMIKARNAQK